MRTPLRTGLRPLVCLLAGWGVLVAAPAVLAEPLPRFTGYTRMGHPPSGEDGEKGKEEGVARDERVVGVTVYYMVLDQQAGTAGRGDTWGVGVEDFDSFFV